MIKRVVVLQDESLVIQELARGPRQSLAAQAAPASVPQAEIGAAPAFVSPTPPQPPMPRFVWRAGRRAARRGDRRNGVAGPLGSASSVAVLDAPLAPAVPDKPMPLAEVAKNAAVHAERIAIEEAFHRVHWNRRKAAVQLGVSYKTLLNKIKECGISRK